MLIYKHRYDTFTTFSIMFTRVWK